MSGTFVRDVVIHFDGASRGNPGEAGYGYYILDPGRNQVLVSCGGYLGYNFTNNFAEYTGLIEALVHARRIHAQSVDIYGDSELVVKQINGEYRVSSRDLRPLYDEAMNMIRSFQYFTISHIRREQNTKADQLANKAIQLRRNFTE
eukprot:GHVU01074249.1.p1 GENE.GHVU01074249.1~~GHVU01074249.1.p1  ORF type:complete len:146 (+),score=8.27 GHVU01074249.1:149-586(+)